MPLVRSAHAAFALAALAGAALAAGSLSPSEQRGKQIYLTGKSPGGEAIVATLGEGGAEVPASLVPCGSCHGSDGRGRPEGGAVPSDITWPALTRSDGVRHASGREHPAYDERSLVKAIAMGVDPAGNALSAVMPRYRLSQQDAADLAAYVKRIADDRDPGIADTELTVGLVLAPDPAAAAAAEEVLRALAAEINDKGGLYGRKLRFVRIAPAGAPAERAAALAAFLDREQPFALVAPFLVGAEREMAAVLAERSVPAVGALAGEPALEPLNRYVFYLYGGLSAQTLALVDRLAGADDAAPWALVVPGDPNDPARVEALAAAVEARARGRGLPPPRRLAYGDLSEAVATARGAGTRAVLFLGGAPDAARFLEQAAAGGWEPWFLAPGSAAGGAVLGRASAFRGRASLSFPTLSADLSPAGLAELERLSGAGQARPPGPAQPPPPAQQGRAARASALAAAKLLVDALGRLGRGLSREALVRELEGVYRFSTGLTPPLTFGPNVRVGAAGAWVVEVDPASGTISGGEWIAVE